MTASELVDLGIQFYDLGNFQAAMQMYDRAIRLDPNFPRAYNCLGNVYKELGKTKEAMRVYDQAIKLNPKYDHAFHNRALLYSILGQLEKSIQDCTHAININPNDFRYYYNRGARYLEKGDFDNALSDFHQLILLNQNLGRAYQALGDIYSKKHEYDTAIEYYTRAIELKSELALNAYLMRGHAYKQKAEFDKEKQNFLELLEYFKYNKNKTPLIWAGKKRLEEVLNIQMSAELILNADKLIKIFKQAKLDYQKNTKTSYKMWFGFDNRFPTNINDENVYEKLAEFLSSDHNLTLTSLKAFVLKQLPFVFENIKFKLYFRSLEDLKECHLWVLDKLPDLNNGKTPAQEGGLLSDEDLMKKGKKFHDRAKAAQNLEEDDPLDKILGLNL